MDWTTFLFLLAISAVTLFACIRDKKAIEAEGTPLPTRLILVLCLAGGSPGMLLGMYLYHPQTKQLKYRLSVPIIFIGEALFLIWFYYRRMHS